MSDIFEYLEAQAQEDNLPFKSAAVVAIDRAERQFGSFLSSAKGEKEFDARVALLQDQIISLAADVCDEYGYDDPAHIARLVIGQMQVVAGGTDPTQGLDIERQTMPTQDPKGYYTQQTGPALNPNSAGDNMKNTNPPIPELTPDESQDVTEKTWPWDGALPEQDRMDMSRGKAKSSAMMGDTWVGGDEEEEDRRYQEPKDYLDTEGEDEEPVLDGGMGNRNRDRSQGSEGEEHSDKDLYAQRWDAEKDDKNWKNYRDKQYHPEDASGHDEFPDHDLVHAKTAAERMDLDNLVNVMRPSEAVDFLVKDGMPYHEAQTRVDEYVNHLNPGWASKHWKANYEMMDEGEATPAGIDDVEMMNVAGQPSAQEASNVYHEMGISPEQRDMFVGLLTRFWTESYPEMDPQAIASMVQEGASTPLGNIPASMASVTKQADMPDHKFYEDLAGWLDTMVQENIDENNQEMTPQKRQYIEGLAGQAREKANRLRAGWEAQWADPQSVTHAPSQREQMGTQVSASEEPKEPVGGHKLKKQIKEFYKDPEAPPNNPKQPNVKGEFSGLDKRNRPVMTVPPSKLGPKKKKNKKSNVSNIVTSALDNINKKK